MPRRPRTSADGIPRVTPGIVFSSPPPLPRGRHGLSREEVLLAQRERIMIAFTELVAVRGYWSVTVADVVARAGVSRQAFYGCFADKEACAIACYERFIDVLLARVAGGLTATDDRTIWLSSAISAYLGTLQADHVSARAFLIEPDAAGAPARQRRRQALGRFADVIHVRYEEFRATDPELGPLPRSAHLSAIYALRQLACDALEESEDPDLLALAPDALQWMSARDLGARLVRPARAKPRRRARAARARS
jgi:AcrR family transcriptional regulator